VADWGRDICVVLQHWIYCLLFNNLFVYTILIVLYVSSDAAEVCDVLAR